MTLPPPLPSLAPHMMPAPCLHRHVYEVHRLALAADRSQVVVVKAQITRYCYQPGIARTSVCEAPLSKQLDTLKTAIADLEAYHQVRGRREGPTCRRNAYIQRNTYMVMMIRIYITYRIATVLLLYGFL